MNPFAAGFSKNQYLRKFGTDQANSVDPYITGYMFVKFEKVPKLLPEMIGRRTVQYTETKVMPEEDIKAALAASCVAVTIPGATINKADMQGLGGIRWSAPASIEWDNNISMRFFETSGLTIHKIFHSWVKLIRDYRGGVSGLRGFRKEDPKSYTVSNYSGDCLYWTTRPDGLTAEYACYITGLWPTKDPSDLFGHDIQSYDKLEIDIDFSVNWIWHEPWVYEKIEKYLGTYDVYGGDSGYSQDDTLQYGDSNP